MRTLVTLEQLKHHLSYDPETGVFLWKNPTNWRITAGDAAGNIKVHKSGYQSFEIQLLGHSYKAARLAWLYMTGQWPVPFAEHIDGNALNQIWTNLREADNFINAQNMHRAPSTNKSSGLLGVTRNPHPGPAWVARITANGRSHYLGKFDDKDRAHAIYLEAKRRLHAGCTI